jgi:hypothetical protein
VGDRKPSAEFSHTPGARSPSQRPDVGIFVQVAMPQAPDRVPAQYLLSPRAPSPRTLIDILHETASRYPEAAAIDDGTVQLTYSELISDIEASVAWLAARGIGRGDRIGIRMPSGSFALYEAILATLATGAAYVPVDADDPDERAELVFAEANVVAVLTEAGMTRGPGSSRGWRAGAPLTRDDAWIIFTSGSTGTPSRTAMRPRSSTPKRRCSCRTTQLGQEIGCWPGCRWHSTRRVKRCGWHGGTALAWSRRRGRWCAAAWTWVRGWSPATSPWSRRCRRWPRCGPPRRSKRCGC